MDEHLEQHEYPAMQWINRIFWWLGLPLLSPGYLFCFNEELVLQVMSSAQHIPRTHLLENGVTDVNKLALIRIFFCVDIGHLY